MTHTHAPDNTLRPPSGFQPPGWETMVDSSALGLLNAAVTVLSTLKGEFGLALHSPLKHPPLATWVNSVEIPSARCSRVEFAKGLTKNGKTVSFRLPS